MMKTTDEIVAKLIADGNARVLPTNQRYCVSKDGRVFSRTRLGKTKRHWNTEPPQMHWRELRANSKHKYPSVTISGLGKCGIHKLVALVWLDPPSDSKSFAYHIDGNRRNNHADNLIWMPGRHAQKTRGSNHPHNKLREDEVLKIRTLVNKKISLKSEVARRYGVSRSTVRDIVDRKTWAWL